VALQSNADLCLLNRLLPDSSVFLPPLPVFNSASTNICVYTVPQYDNSKLLSSHLINTFPLPRSIPLSLTVPRPYFSLRDRFFSVRLWACHPTLNLEGQSAIFKTPREGWPRYTLRHWVTILVIFYDLHGLQWDYSFPQALDREKYIKYHA